MKNKASKIFLTGILSLVIMMASVGDVLVVAAKDDPQGQYYDFGSKDGYKYTSATGASTQDSKTLGSFSVWGDYTKEGDNYVVADDGSIIFRYDMNEEYLVDRSTVKEWHIMSDSGKSVAGVSLSNKVGLGAMIVQTSPDNKNWTNRIKLTDIFAEDTSKQTLLNSVVISGGVYVRVIVAYKLGRKTGTKKEWFKTKDVYQYNYKAEVYSFYLSYKDSKAYTNGEVYKLGKVKRVSGSGFGNASELKKGDPHFGWDLGQFCISGCTAKTEDGDVPVFLKNVGDKVSFWFELDQNIKKLNGKSDLSIKNSKGVYDNHFGLASTEFGKGMLIIRKTDYNNNVSEPTKYKNYIDGVSKGTADTQVILFEEGDYEVALDYQIFKDNTGLFSKDQTFSYQILFKFKVRNGDCNGFLFELDENGNKKGEILNNAYIPNGFTIDLAKSRYLSVSVERQIIVQNGDYFSLDTRVNQASNDGKKYTDEGIYTITVHNKYLANPTIKKIYVGENQLISAFVKSGYSFEKMIETDLSKVGVDNDGYLINLVDKNVLKEEAPVEEADNEIVVRPSDEPEEEFAMKADDKEKSTNKAKKSGISKGVLLGIIVILVAIGGAIFAFIKMRGKKVDVNDKKE